MRGCGGAGFTTGMKWQFAADAEADKRIIICNADEGEPGTFKDRVLLTERPHLLIEGMTIAARAIGASEGILYLRGEYVYLRELIEEVLADRRARGMLGKDIFGVAGFNFDIRLQLGAGAYICGEEGALISSCEGLPGEPKTRPPFPVTKRLSRPSDRRQQRRDLLSCRPHHGQGRQVVLQASAPRAATAPSCSRSPAIASIRASTSCPTA